MVKNMKKDQSLLEHQVESRDSSLTIIGYILIVMGVVDFLLSFAGINLTSFFGPLSRFTPIAFGILGSLLIKANNNN